MAGAGPEKLSNVDVICLHYDSLARCCRKRLRKHTRTPPLHYAPDPIAFEHTEDFSQFVFSESVHFFIEMASNSLHTRFLGQHCTIEAK